MEISYKAWEQKLKEINKRDVVFTEIIKLAAKYEYTVDVHYSNFIKVSFMCSGFEHTGYPYYHLQDIGNKEKTIFIKTQYGTIIYGTEFKFLEDIKNGTIFNVERVIQQ